MKIIKLMTMTNSNFKEPDLYRREEGGKEINERERVNPKDQSERENRENESRSGKTDQADGGAPPVVLEQSTCVRSEQVLELKLLLSICQKDHLHRLRHHQLLSFLQAWMFKA